MRKAVIVGAGMMGSAMAIPLSDNGFHVRLVGSPLDDAIIESVRKSGWHPTLKRQMPEHVEAYFASELRKQLAGADLVVGGVSSFGVQWFEREVLPLVPEGTPVVFITKGLEKEPDGTLLPFPLAMAGRMDKRRGIALCGIGGPCISFELADRHQTDVWICAPDADTGSHLAGWLRTPYYHLRPTTDIRGIESAVAMKNAYALGVALAIGMAQKQDADAPERYNPEAALFAQATREARKIIALNGGEPEAIACFAGDLYVTVFGGRTRKIGTLLGKGLPYAKAREMLSGVTLESVAIATTVMEAFRNRSDINVKEFPLLSHIDAIINQGAPVEVPWDSFME
ncbi:MAG: hypothetical protein SPF89_09320 [Sphaerochaetaceae bacterium]|nr:hypothetical protein [Spirochaetales bacterium]MDY5500291.1 hypothetical protein [Sphaerochaetaceae bacterium]